jgi:hypothetical protein
MSLYLLIVKRQSKAAVFPVPVLASPTRSVVFAKSSGIAFAEFLWVQQFSTQKLLLELALKS